MPLNFSLTLTIDETKEEITVSGEFSDDEVKILNNFVEEANQVWQTDFIQTGEKGQLKIGSKDGINIEIETVLPDWNQVAVFLHKFRPILLKNERTYFYDVLALLGRKLDNPYFRNSLKIQKNLFSGKTHHSQLQIKNQQVLLNSENFLYDYLNAHEYHRDELKQQFIESLHQVFPLDASKVILLALLIDKAEASISVADLIQVILGKQNEIEIRTNPPESN